jgi:hypothetical protein
MTKSSIDYSEIAGLTIAQSRLSCKSDKTNEETVVRAWIVTRINELRSK